jgi:hypothetical protein
MKTDLTAEYVRSILDYDPASGALTWKRGYRHLKAGSKAGYKTERGYVIIRIDTITYQAHRLAWLIMTGAWPELIVDHKDENKSNNAWSNLREVSIAENTQNVTAPQRDNASGFRGVYWQRDKRKWRAQITVSRKLIYLGRYSSPEEASAAYEAARLELHPGFLARKNSLPINTNLE